MPEYWFVARFTSWTISGISTYMKSLALITSYIFHSRALTIYTPVLLVNFRQSNNHDISQQKSRTSYCFHSKCILRIFQISHKNLVAPPEPGVDPQAYIGPINQGFVSTSSNVCEFNISKMKITPARFTSYDKTAHTLNIRWSTENFFHNRQLGSSIRPLTHLGIALFDWSPPGTTKQVYRN